jgi:hypothetical protein
MFRKLFQIATISLIFISFHSKVNATSLSEAFSYNSQAIELEFASVKPLESFIENNFEKADFSFVKLNNGIILSNVENTLNLNPNLPNAGGDYPILGIPSFVWGFCLGVIGIVAVAVIGNDLPKDEKQAQVKKSAVGCLVGWGIGAVVYFVVLGGAFAAGI